ncbi:MAG: class I SAM-dependent methyltransferase [Candidatus Rifleibacteriota bacterium]
MQHEDNAAAYDAGMKLHWFGSYNAFRRSIVENFGSFRDSTILDFGCGTGLLLEFIKSNYSFDGCYIGVDPGAGMLRVANSKSIAHEKKLFAQIPLFPKLPVRSESIDIFASSLVTHQISVEGKKALLEEVKRVLKPGGIAVMAEFGKPSNFFGKLVALYTMRIWGHAIPQIGENSPSNFIGMMPKLFAEAGFNDLSVVSRWKGAIDIITGKK